MPDALIQSEIRDTRPSVGAYGSPSSGVSCRPRLSVYRILDVHFISSRQWNSGPVLRLGIEEAFKVLGPGAKPGAIGLWHTERGNFLYVLVNCARRHPRPRPKRRCWSRVSWMLPRHRGTAGRHNGARVSSWKPRVKASMRTRRLRRQEA